MEYNTGIAVNTSFPNFQAALEHIFELAKTGFTKGCIDRANEMGNVTLVYYEDMLKE